ncbi:MAG: serine hydrolase [Phycisphaerales bacterium]|nr:MAG: serine hydrolase [Phycisphaerales bacterium]
MKRACPLATTVLLMLSSIAWATSRVPGENWMMYASPEEAGFSAEKLAEAKAYWESIPSAALMVIYDGAVAVAWGDVDRRYMCHSVRKSLLSGLIGIHVDAGHINLEKNLAQLGIDDDPPLTDTEKQARIIDLLRARSGVYRLAAYEPPQNPKPPRGSHAPGTNWCYNNWDFNTLCTIFERETGTKIFEEFEKRFAAPLGMQDFRVRDGYYHYERDKSIHPAYPFRMSARDMARFGLLFLNKGEWDGRRILSEEWVADSTTSYSDTGRGLGYGYMWWIALMEPFAGLGTYAARGVGEQCIDVLPGANMVFVNRADTYHRQMVNGGQHVELLTMILDAKTGEPKPNPKLVPLPPVPRTYNPVPLSDDKKKALCGEYPINPGLDATIRVRLDGQDLVLETNGGDFDLTPLAGGKFLVGDAEQECRVLYKGDGSVANVFSELILNHAGYRYLNAGQTGEAIRVLKKATAEFPGSANAYDSLAEAYLRAGKEELAVRAYEKVLRLDPLNRGAMQNLKRLGAWNPKPAKRCKLPETPVGQCAAAYFDVFNSGDDDRMRSYLIRYKTDADLQEHPLDQRIQQYHDLRNQWGTLTPTKVARQDQRQLTVLVRDSKADDGWVLHFQLVQSPPDKLDFLTFSGPFPPDLKDETIIEIAENARP